MRTLCSLLVLTLLLPAAAGLPRPAAAQASGTCTVGAKVSVNWKGDWYPAVIKAGPDAQGRCLIGYDGHHSHWDEWVGPDRRRAPGQPGSGSGSRTSASVGRQGAPTPGVYPCYASTAYVGIQRLHTFALLSGGSYMAKDGSRGAFTYDAASGLLTMTSGALRGTRYRQTAPGALRYLDKSGELTQFSCPLDPKRNTTDRASW